MDPDRTDGGRVCHQPVFYRPPGRRICSPKDFETHNRKKFCARIATGDYDAIIMGHSQFERIPISRERQERLLYEQIDEITEGIAEVQASGGERFTVKQLERTRKSLELFNLLADDYRTYVEIELTKGRRELTEDDERDADALCKRYLERWREELE